MYSFNYFLITVYPFRILVMARGKVSEFDRPSILLVNPNSEFRKMVAEAGLLS